MLTQLGPHSAVAKAELKRKATEAFWNSQDVTEAWCVSRGLAPVRVWHGLGCTTGVDGCPEGRISIPSIATNGNVTHISYRALGESQAKYMHEPGASRVFNPRALDSAATEGGVIHLTEGQVDAMSLTVAGVNAIGILGAKAFKPHHARLFGAYRVIVWGDNDTAGNSFSDTITGRLPDAARGIVPAGYNDLNEWLCSDAESFIEKVRETK